MRCRWPRLKLRTRIALTILLALLAVQVADAVVLYLVFPRFLNVSSGHWLIETAENAARTVFQADPKARDAVAAQFGADNHLHIRWRPEENAVTPGPSEIPKPFIDKARVSIERGLKGNARQVSMRGIIGVRGKEINVPVRYQPPDFAKHVELQAQDSSDQDFPIVGGFELAIQGLDGSWLVIEPEGTLSLSTRLRVYLFTLLGAAALAFLLSDLVAKRTLRPLDRLTCAARDFGRTRKAAPVDTAGLREFEVIALAINEMQERIKRFLDERTRMVATLSHDLRTNLTGLLLDAEDLPEGDTKKCLVAGIEDMERMISATLAFAGDELKGEPPQAVDLAALLISLCDNFSDRDCAASYSGPDHLSAICQPVAMKRAFANLIDNAIKYGGCARVQLSRLDLRAEITVADDGPGIPPDKVALAFEPFRRLDTSRDRNTGGTGLGLTIARDIVQSHGGEISLGTPPEGRGLEVRVSLPLPSPARN
jgi:signal transduction histidine kinase